MKNIFYYLFLSLTLIFACDKKEVSVTGVGLNKTSTIITVGGTETLTATIAPANAENKAVAWSSSNTNIATVNAVVTAIAAGTAIIIAKSVGGNKTATRTVTIEGKLQ